MTAEAAVNNRPKTRTGCVEPAVANGTNSNPPVAFRTESSSNLLRNGKTGSRGAGLDVLSAFAFTR
jgi:hypothetical protein